MSFKRETAKVSLQTAIYDLCRAGVLYIALDWIKPWLVEKAKAMSIPGAVAWSTLVLVFVAFFGVFVFDWWRASRKIVVGRVDLVPSAITPIRALERFYMALASLREHVDMLNKMETMTGEHRSMVDTKLALEKIRKEIIDLSPTVFPMSLALDMKEIPNAGAGIEHLTDRILPGQIDDLMNAVRRHWGVYGEKAGIAPLRFKEQPIVKLSD